MLYLLITSHTGHFISVSLVSGELNQRDGDKSKLVVLDWYVTKHIAVLLLSTIVTVAIYTSYRYQSITADKSELIF